MKDQLPAPDFDANRYERPTQKWICGHAADGAACRVGPDCHGNCRATYECTPGVELKEGENKGRFRCTRPKEFGGPCEHGPMPDGMCSRAVPKCVPVRSLRAKRGLFAWAVISLTVAVILIALAGSSRLRWINPGPLSEQHSTPAFARLHGKGTNEIHGCAACHTSAQAGFSGWLTSALGADPGPLHFNKLMDSAPPGLNTIDQACQKCHLNHGFHEPNVVRDHSCSACHQEHRGTLALHNPEDRNCASCHADAAVMEASYEKGKTMAAGLFDFRPSLGRMLFNPPRPERGYTKAFRSFADHPEFQVIAENLREPNTLKFNHQRHFAEDISALNGGKKLDCVQCHQADASGQYLLKVRFDAHCASCHGVQFDAANPKMKLPHGNTEAVRSYLRSLPVQYADFAARELGITDKRRVESFVREQLTQLREQMSSVEELEQKVFFSDKRWAPGGRVGSLPDGGRPMFYGCAYCHEVKPGGNSTASVTPPVVPDRWFVRGAFDHSKHANISCAQCHNTAQSRDTADILLPKKESCVTCHSPQGGVAHSCSTCHSYHTPRRITVAGPAAASAR